MNISMYTLFYRSLRALGAERAADLALSVGFDSVEMLEGRYVNNIPDVESARKVRKALDSRGLRMSCYSFATDVVCFDENGRLNDTSAESEQRAIKAASIAKELGSPYFHHTLVLNLDSEIHKKRPSFDEIFDALVASASRIAKKCNDLGLAVLYEPQGLYVNGNENFGMFYREMKRFGHNVGVCGDIGNVLFVDGSPSDFYREFADEFRHIHLKDYRCLGDSANLEKGCLRSERGKVYKETVIGEGVVGFRECMEILKASGYSGALSLEMEAMSDDPISEYRKTIKSIREIFDSERK